MNALPFRKPFFLFLVTVLHYSFVFPQEETIYKKAVTAYFRSSPFDKTPDDLFKELLADSSLAIDTVVYPSDTSFFYLRGYYKTFNPFSGNINTVELLFHEASASNNSDKRVLTYEIIGVLNRENNGRNRAMEEEKNIFLKFRKVFSKWGYNESGKKAKWPSGSHYYLHGFSAPVFSGWGIWYKTKNDYCVSVSVHLSSLQ